MKSEEKQQKVTKMLRGPFAIVVIWRKKWTNKREVAQVKFTGSQLRNPQVLIQRLSSNQRQNRPELRGRMGLTRFDT